MELENLSPEEMGESPRKTKCLYFVDSNVKRNRRLEFSIARLFLGLGTCRLVLLWNGIKYLKPGIGVETKYRTRKFGYVMYLVVLIIMYFMCMSKWR